MLVEDSSTKIRRFGSTPLRGSRKALLASSSRSVATSVFFVGPPELVAYSPTHRGGRNPNPPLGFPQLAVALQCGIVVLFELFPKRPLFLGASEDAPLAFR